MKIWIQSFNYYPHELGGSERSARDLARGLAARGHSVTVLLSDGSKPYPDTVDGIPIKVIEGLSIGKSPLWPSRGFLQRSAWNLRSEIDPVLQHRLTRELEDERPRCVVINNPAGHGSALLSACRVTGVPVLPVIRDYGWFCAFGTMMRGNKRCDEPCTKCALFSKRRRAHLSRITSIAISDHVASLINRLVDSPRVEVIYNSIPDEFRRPRTQNIKEYRGPLRFGYIGRLHPTKGVSETIEGWIRSEIYRAGHKLFLAGENQGLQLPADPSSFGIEVLGSQRAIDFLDTLDVLIVPSIWAEPFGRAVIEGLSRGLYVVGSPNGAIPDLIPTDLGEVLPEVSPSSLAECFTRLARAKAQDLHMDEAQRLRVIDTYAYSRMLDHYESVIHRVAGTRTPT